MSAFLDASVIVAILAHETDEQAQIARIENSGEALYFSAVVVFEAAFSLARKKAPAGQKTTQALIEEAHSVVVAFLDKIGAKEVAISGTITTMAVDAGARFGKVVGHPAKLNLGDCFAYACARSQNATLLYKGDDFAKTDIPSA